MSAEYAMLRNGEITTIVTTYGAPPEARPGCEVKPLDQVPDEVKKRYRYWDERP
jgi:hypothetical protein